MVVVLLILTAPNSIFLHASKNREKIYIWNNSYFPSSNILNINQEIPTWNQYNSTTSWKDEWFPEIALSPTLSPNAWLPLQAPRGECSLFDYLLCKTAEWPNLLTSRWRSGLGSTDQRSQARSTKNTSQRGLPLRIHKNQCCLGEQGYHRQTLHNRRPQVLGQTLTSGVNVGAAKQWGLEEGRVTGQFIQWVDHPVSPSLTLPPMSCTHKKAF